MLNTAQTCTPTAFAVLCLEGGDCVEHSDAIASSVRDVDGLADLRIDAARRRIHVLYNGEWSALESVVAVVRGLGFRVSLFQMADTKEGL